MDFGANLFISIDKQQFYMIFSFRVFRFFFLFFFSFVGILLAISCAAIYNKRQSIDDDAE